jgi:quercetin dioxygenase-like cupin family protein
MDPASTHMDRVDLTRRAVTRFGAGGLALALVARSFSAGAQDATPTPDPEGVVGDVLGSGLPSSASGMELAVRRTTIAPGGGLPPHSHPGAIAFAVDAGTWGITILEGTAQVTRAGGDATPAAAEEVEIGVELILTKGDSLFAEAFRDQMRNAGEDDVVLLMAALTSVDQDFQTD